ncbi:hypothetical protein EON65_25855 [archaeon]|nr:MAG: hypothetical protein EON65_25855 [archaeon]
MSSNGGLFVFHFSRSTARSPAMSPRVRNIVIMMKFPTDNKHTIIPPYYIAAKARGNHLRIHFKHTREIGKSIVGKTVGKAKTYLENVLQFKEAIPVTKYTGGIGRHSIGKKYKAPGDKVSWPQKATRTFLDLLTNIESNATVGNPPEVSTSVPYHIRILLYFTIRNFFVRILNFIFLLSI